MILLSLTVVACQTVEVPNVEICIKAIDGGFCTWTIEGEDRDMTEMEFEAEKLGIIYMQGHSWAAIRKNIEEQCIKNKNCRDSRNAEKMQAFFDRLENAGDM